MTDDLQTFLKDVSTAVEAELDRLIPDDDVEPVKLHKAIRHSIFAGGKRFRPALLYAVGRAFGAADEKLVTTAAAIEMIHTYSLIHDDLPAMDDDDLRRGRPTCHKVFGEATAILAGDVLQTLAFQAVSMDRNLDPETRIRLVGEIALASGTPAGMVAGQQLDLEGEGRNLAESELEGIHHRKTGAMIVASARCGALIAGAEETKLTAITQFASMLGLLFQITDDLLDVTQTTSVLGKTAGKDELVEKATYPSLYGIDETRRLAKSTREDMDLELEKIDEPEVLHMIADFVLTRLS